MNKKIDVGQLVEMSKGGHPGSIYSANQAGVPEAFVRLAVDADLRVHRLVMGKTRDGMSGLLAQKMQSTCKGSRQTTGLLDTLMRRI